MKDLIENLSLFGTLIGLGAIWFVLPTLVVFPLMYRLKKGKWRFPCNFVDVITICSICILWVKFAHDDALGRGLGLLCDLIATGFAYGFFSVSTNLLPRDFSINFITSNGVQTNTMLHLDINQDGVAKEKGIRP